MHPGHGIALPDHGYDNHPDFWIRYALRTAKNWFIWRGGYRAVDASAMDRPYDKRHLARCHRRRHELGPVPAKELGRWALTIVTTLPIPALFCGWLLLPRTANPAVEESPDLVGLIAMSVVSALSSLPSLFLVWSPKGRMVFSPGYRQTIRQTPELRPGCSGFLPTLVAVPAVLVSYLMLLVTVLTILVMLGLIRSFCILSA